MKKTMIYVIAVLACLTYIVALALFLYLIKVDIEDLGILWQGLILGGPVIGIWTIITLKTKKENNDPEKDDSNH